MAFDVVVHYDNRPRFRAPHLWVWYAGSAVQHDLAQTGVDDFGPVFAVSVRQADFGFTFKDGPGTGGPWEGGGLDRTASVPAAGGAGPAELWCRGDRAFVYPLRPATADAEPAGDFLRRLVGGAGLRPGSRLADTGGLSGLGATVLADGRVLFGLYHPTAARVYVAGSFNDWQCPGHGRPEPAEFVEARLHRGYFDLPNTWLAVTDRAAAGDEYKFFVQGGVPDDGDGRAERYTVDPYARRLGADLGTNNGVVVDPSTFAWTDQQWRTPDPADLVLYEMSVHGFTDGDPDIAAAGRGRFSGITERVREGYFDDLGVSALSLMPLAEVPSQQGPDSLGYDPSLYLTVERDFGGPDDLRALVDAAHRRKLALLVDMVFNHTSNSFNPLWGCVLEQPGHDGTDPGGGLYFNGTTPWGNRVATEKDDVQTMLIDACKAFVDEYHVDGFRLDATHTDYMDHGFLRRLAAELRARKPDVLLVAENLPNQPDLDLGGADGYGQWCELFHDKIKALLREGPFEGQDAGPDGLGDVFYFSRSRFAAHTNNVVNYCESHDENSVAYEMRFTPWLDTDAAKDRKGRLGLFATLVGLGQPMLYMGQEFNVERPRNIVTVEWPSRLDEVGFFQWCRRLIRLRRRYPGLRLTGADPAAHGFRWILGPWMDGDHGGGRRVIGWRSRPNELASDTVVVLLNFEGFDVSVDLELGSPGRWVKLADIDRVDDIPPQGANSADDPTALVSADGRFASFTLPGSSGFLYKWEAPLPGPR